MDIVMMNTGTMDIGMMLLVVMYWVLLIGVVAAVTFYFVRKWYYSRNSAAGKRLVSRLLRRHGALRGWRCLDNVTLGEGKDAMVADHIIVAPFGVIVACDLHERGNVYGELQDAQWIITNGEEGKENGKATQRSYIPSPYHRAQIATEQLRAVFAKNKVYNVPVEVLVPKTMKQSSFITGTAGLLLSRKELKSQLERSRYDENKGVDVAKIAALLQAK